MTTATDGQDPDIDPGVFMRHNGGTYQVQFDPDGILWCRYIGSGALGSWCRDANLARAAFLKAQGRDE